MPQCYFIRTLPVLFMYYLCSVYAPKRYLRNLPFGFLASKCLTYETADDEKTASQGPVVAIAAI
jgi:hypothetical protein